MNNSSVIDAKEDLVELVDQVLMGEIDSTEAVVVRHL